MSGDLSQWMPRARELCWESDEHHARVWFCMSCHALAQRLRPMWDDPAFKALLEEEVVVSRVYSWTPGEQEEPCTTKALES